MQEQNFQPHIGCKQGDISDIILLPGDPKRVLKITQYLSNVQKVADNREFLTYTGEYQGIKVTVTSTGVGGPSAAIAIEELANLGAKYFIRIGTCGALKQGIQEGDLIIPYAAIRDEGTTKEYIKPEYPAVADFEIVQALVQASKNNNFKFFTGINRTHDAFYENIDNILKWDNISRDQRMAQWNSPVISSEMECSVLFTICSLRGLKSGAVLAVNTIEPLDRLRDNPELIYHLSNSEQANNGVDKAIKTALEAVKIYKQTEI